ncbi:MAG: hypothetical protein ACPG5T_06350 [Endozoicomonas sp.]
MGSFNLTGSQKQSRQPTEVVAKGSEHRQDKAKIGEKAQFTGSK